MRVARSRPVPQHGDSKPGWLAEAKHQREAVPLVSEMPHSEWHRHTLNVGKPFGVAAGEENIAIGFRVGNRNRRSDQESGTLCFKLREDGSPARLVHSIPAWDDRLREDEQRVGMGQRNLLDRPLLEF